MTALLECGNLVLECCSSSGVRHILCIAVIGLGSEVTRGRRGVLAVVLSGG